MKLHKSVKVALAAAGAVALIAGVTSPAKAATRSTVVLADTNAFTSLNNGTPDTNLVINGNVAYLTGIGFNYYNDKPELVRNTTFGSYKIMQKSPTFVVKYTIAPGVVWSDGTKITAEDLLMTHITSSNDYSIAAGLGDPDAGKNAFDSLGYNGSYSQLIKDVAVDSGHRSLTVTYSKYFPDWELYGPGVFPAHAITALALGEKSLGTSSHNIALKNKFWQAFTSKNTDLLKKIAAVYSKGYNVTSVDDKTNPLLLVCNGAYQVSKVVKDQSVTLKVNPRYNSGPKLNGIDTVVIKVIPDATAAAQALANKELDIFENASATADSVAALKKIAGINVDGSTVATYEHVEVRSGKEQGGKTEYTGPFAGMSQKAKDLRTAFLLAYPREEIVEKLVKPVSSKVVVMNSLQYFPSEPNYAKMVKASGMDKFTAGTQADRTAQALALVKKYYPSAAAGSGSVKIKLLWGQPSNVRRSGEAALVKAEEAKAGFDVTITGTSGWSTYLSDVSFDAQFYAWSKTALTQTGNFGSYKATESHTGYDNAEVDKVISELEVGNYSASEIYDRYLKIEKIMAEDAVSLPIFQWPGIVAYSDSLKGINPGPLSPTYLWNFWDWHY